MPIKTEYKTEQEVRDIPVTGLVSYSCIIDETYRLIKEKGLIVTDTSFKPSSNKDTVTAHFIVRKEAADGKIESEDVDMDMAISWTHSYHKAIRFQCNTSGIIPNGSSMIRSISTSSKSRRPSDATKYQNEIFDDLKLEISYIEDSFNKIVNFKNYLVITRADLGAASIILGMLYVEEEVLTTSQIAVIKDNIRSNEIKTGWDIYQCVADGLKDSHPKLLIDDHINTFKFFEEIFPAEVVKPKEESLHLPNKYIGKSVDEEIKERYDFKSPLSSVVFL